MLNLDHITPALTEDFLDAVRLLQTYGRPELTPDQAVLEAVNDWIALARFEHLDSYDTP